MKNIRTFENWKEIANKMGFNYYDLRSSSIDKAYWFIRGGRSNILEILNRFIKDPNEIVRITERYRSWSMPHLYGIFLSYDKSAQFGQNYGIVAIQSEEHSKKLTHLKNWGYQYMGELKIENGELVLDDLDVDMEKYNL